MNHCMRKPVFQDWSGPDALVVVMPTGVYLLDLFCSGIQFYVLLSPRLCFISFLYLDLYVLRGLVKKN